VRVERTEPMAVVPAGSSDTHLGHPARLKMRRTVSTVRP
jgi:hypothetical protein